jgi:hypothetical protein
MIPARILILSTLSGRGGRAIFESYRRHPNQEFGVDQSKGLPPA